VQTPLDWGLLLWTVVRVHLLDQFRVGNRLQVLNNRALRVLGATNGIFDAVNPDVCASV